MSEKDYIAKALESVSLARDAVLKIGELSKIDYEPPNEILEEIRDVMDNAIAESYGELGITQVTVKDPMGIGLLTEAIEILLKYEKGMKHDDILELIHQARCRIRNVRHREKLKK